MYVCVCVCCICDLSKPYGHKIDYSYNVASFSSRSWQTMEFEPCPVTFIKIVGTTNTANEVFHCVHFECPASGYSSSHDTLRYPLF